MTQSLSTVLSRTYPPSSTIAAEIIFSPSGTIASTNVQAAIQELDTIPAHASTGGLQGGTADEYFHLTSAEYTGTGTGTFVRKTNPAVYWAITTKSADYQATVADYTVLTNATLAPVTVTLPDATTCLGQVFVVKKIDSSVNHVIINTLLAQTIDGSPSYSISRQYFSLTLHSDGTNFNII